MMPNFIEIDNKIIATAHIVYIRFFANGMFLRGEAVIHMDDGSTHCFKGQTASNLRAFFAAPKTKEPEPAA